jgi:predicted metal-dependent HD superfamily phosphohydrolase
MELLDRWTSLDAGTADDGRDLLARYAEPHRRYHDQRHLMEVLDALDHLTDDVPVAVACAAWFHDAVYAPARDDNEARSAELAAAVLSRLVPSLVDEVVRLVRLTEGHRAGPDDDTGGLLCDADLAVLASGPERYAAYARDVRAEYAHVSDDAFRTGRAAVLRGLLAAPRLYVTTRGAAWEPRARANLTAELERLSAAGTGADRPPSAG